MCDNVDVTLTKDQVDRLRGRTPKYTIRAVREQELKPLYDECVYAEDCPDLVPVWINGVAERKPAIRLGAFIGDKIVGYIYGYDIGIGAIEVLEAHRCKGIGKELIRAFTLVDNQSEYLIGDPSDDCMTMLESI